MEWRIQKKVGWEAQTGSLPSLPPAANVPSTGHHLITWPRILHTSLLRLADRSVFTSHTPRNWVWSRSQLFVSCTHPETQGRGRGHCSQEEEWWAAKVRGGTSRQSHAHLTVYPRSRSLLREAPWMSGWLRREQQEPGQNLLWELVRLLLRALWLVARVWGSGWLVHFVLCWERWWEK